MSVENDDYQGTMRQLVFNLTSGNTLCFGILIFANDGLENTENFTVMANTNSSLIANSSRTQEVTVNIYDSDGKHQ